jgi:hypothetical protein
VTGIAPVTLHLHEEIFECAYGATKSSASKISRLSISQASGRIRPAHDRLIRFQFELNTFAVFICAGLGRNSVRISECIAENQVAKKYFLLHASDVGMKAQ